LNVKERNTGWMGMGRNSWTKRLRWMSRFGFWKSSGMTTVGWENKNSCWERQFLSGKRIGSAKNRMSGVRMKSWESIFLWSTWCFAIFLVERTWLST
jgi:hypothetical protein